MAQRDGFGRLALQLVYSDNEGLEVLRSHAHDFGCGRGTPATAEELNWIVRNQETAWGSFSMPMHDDVTRAEMHLNEVVVHVRNHQTEMDEMLRKGIIVDTGRRCCQGYYQDLPIVQVKFVD
ncbi:unnamed protein product [Polarella glacialis]|uniref:Uncharacterized protein n=1 Tax=Polarella glacialis TaxID=89957 RepID=A0A813KM29_POLGL|nr:unnamed protein product [Polarella glacialis]